MNVLCPKCGAPVESTGVAATCAACGATFLAGEAKTTTEAGEPKDPLLGQTIGGCRLLERIGAGGMGVVYKAEQISLGRTVAIKLLPEQLRQDKEIEERFRREISILSKLSHPNIVAILDGGIAEHGAYFVMEHVDGVSLRRVLVAANLSPAEALRIIPQICDALEYAHQRGVIHRDIKPENILLDRDGRVRLLDFGLSRILKTEEPGLVTRATQVLGTFEYMAPEQREASRFVDHRADLYSLGVVIYEMLTGELPIGRFEAPSKRNVQIDVRLDEVVLRVLDKSPDRRYQRASEIKTEVERISTTAPPPVLGVAAAGFGGSAAGFGAGAPPPPPPQQGGFGSREHESGTQFSGIRIQIHPPVLERWLPFGAVLLAGLLGGQWVACLPVLALMIAALRAIETAPPQKANRTAWLAFSVVGVSAVLSSHWPVALPLLGLMVGVLYHFRKLPERPSTMALWVGFAVAGIVAAARGHEDGWIGALLLGVAGFVIVLMVDGAHMLGKPGSGGSAWGGAPPSAPPTPPAAPQSPSGFADAPPIAGASFTSSSVASTPPVASAPPESTAAPIGVAAAAAAPRTSAFATASLWCAVAGLVCIAVLYAMAIPYFVGGPR